MLEVVGVSCSSPNSLTFWCRRWCDDTEVPPNVTCAFSPTNTEMETVQRRSKAVIQAVHPNTSREERHNNTIYLLCGLERWPEAAERLVTKLFNLPDVKHTSPTRSATKNIVCFLSFFFFCFCPPDFMNGILAQLTSSMTTDERNLLRIWRNIGPRYIRGVTWMDVTTEVCRSGRRGHKLVIDVSATGKGMCFQCTSSLCLTDNRSCCRGAFSRTPHTNVLLSLQTQRLTSLRFTCHHIDIVT